MRIGLNLGTNPLENHRRFLVTAGAIALVGVVLLVVLGAHNYREWRVNRELREEVSTLQTEIRNLRAERTELERHFADPATALLLDRASFLNGLIVQRGFQWTQIFMDLERLLPTGVRVVNIAPRMEDGRVELKLVVGAVSDDDKNKFLQRLNESEAFRGYRVLNESRPKNPGELDRVMLELVTHYQSVPREEKPAPKQASGSKQGTGE